MGRDHGGVILLMRNIAALFFGDDPGYSRSALPAHHDAVGLKEINPVAAITPALSASAAVGPASQLRPAADGKWR
jgi:hypothetical protein